MSRWFSADRYLTRLAARFGFGLRFSTTSSPPTAVDHPAGVLLLRQDSPMKLAVRQAQHALAGSPSAVHGSPLSGGSDYFTVNDLPRHPSSSRPASHRSRATLGLRPRTPTRPSCLALRSWGGLEVFDPAAVNYVTRSQLRHPHWNRCWSSRAHRSKHRGHSRARRCASAAAAPNLPLHAPGATKVCVRQRSRPRPRVNGSALAAPGNSIR